MNSVSTQRLTRRLEFATADFLGESAAVAAYQAARQTDHAGKLTPETSAKRALILLNAVDEGRTAIGAPIRNLRLAITLRANSKTDAGGVEELDAMIAAVEQHLDASNLTTALDRATRGVRVMLAVRRPGIGRSVEGLIKMARFEIEVRALRADQTTDGATAEWVDGDGVLIQDGDGTQLVF